MANTRYVDFDKIKNVEDVALLLKWICSGSIEVTIGTDVEMELMHLLKGINDDK